MLASGQTHSRLEPNGDKYNGGSDHQVMVLPYTEMRETRFSLRRQDGASASYPSLEDCPGALNS
jgi:hypothetical protein